MAIIASLAVIIASASGGQYIHRPEFARLSIAEAIAVIQSGSEEHAVYAANELTHQGNLKLIFPALLQRWMGPTDWGEGYYSVFRASAPAIVYSVNSSEADRLLLKLNLAHGFMYPTMEDMIVQDMKRFVAHVRRYHKAMPRDDKHFGEHFTLVQEVLCRSDAYDDLIKVIIDDKANTLRLQAKSYYRDMLEQRAWRRGGG